MSIPQKGPKKEAAGASKSRMPRIAAQGKKNQERGFSTTKWRSRGPSKISSRRISRHDERGGRRSCSMRWSASLVGGHALGVGARGKLASSRKKSGAAGHSHAACQESFDGSIEPNDGDALRAKKFRSTLLRVSSSTEREHQGFLRFPPRGRGQARSCSASSARKSRFAKAFEEFGDAKAGGFLNAVV